MTGEGAGQPQVEGVVGRVGLLDRFLAFWIFLTMAFDVRLGRIWPGIADGEHNLG